MMKVKKSGKKYLEHRGVNRMTKSPYDRFLEKVNIKGPDDCWEWKGAFAGHQAQFRLSLSRANYKTISAQKIAYELWKGEIGDGLVVKRKCRNKKCINPAHPKAVKHGERPYPRSIVCSVCGAKLSRKIQTPSLWKTGRLQCTDCRNDYMREYYREKRKKAY